MGSISTDTIIGGRYRIVALIGDGSMGAVYRVEETDTHEILALKALHSDWSRHPEIIARFEREAIAASRIEHPNVVHATDFGCSADGSFYLVQEYVDGRELRALLQAGPVEATRAVNIMRGVVAGIRAAHDKGIIHRDLKPENIMLVERDGNPDFVRLLDFGIARVESNNPQSGMQALTVAGQPLGTPEYMSPEQVLGKPVDARTDLYSLGVIFYELLAGACPFDGNVPRLLQQHLTSQPPELPSEVAARYPDLARIVRILLAKDPKNRFQSAAELAEALNGSAAVTARRRVPAAPGPRAGEGRTIASLVAMQASLAKKRLVGIVAPTARRGGAWRFGLIAAACAAALAVAIVVVAKRDKGEPAAAAHPEPTATARVEPSRVESTATPPAATDVGKGAAPKPRRKSSEGVSPSKNKAK